MVWFEESRLDTLRRDIATMEQQLTQQDSDLARIAAASNAANSSLAELRALLAERLCAAGVAIDRSAGGERNGDVDRYIAEHLAGDENDDSSSAVVRAAIREALAGVTLR